MNDSNYQSILTYVLFVLGAYLLGSIPTGLWIGLLIYKKDIRQFGSGNIGATNTFRILGKVPGIIALIVDVMKGFIPVLIAKFYFSHLLYLPLITGICAICGHLFSAFLRFKGGKGVATGTGVYLAIAPIPTLIAGVIFLISAFTTRMISVGSVLSAITLAILIALMYKSDILLVVCTCLIAFMILFKHRSNIKRIIRGEENKF